MYQLDIKLNGATHTITTDAPTERLARLAIAKSLFSTPGASEAADWKTFRKPGAKPFAIDAPKKEKKPDVHD